MSPKVIKIAPLAKGYKAITRRRQTGQGNQTIGHLRLTLPDLKFKVSPMVKEVFKWPNYKNHSQWGNMLKSWESIRKQSTNGFTRVGSR